LEVSFIIPLYNRLDLSRPCLESLRASLPRGLAHEIILADDASTDGTRAWLSTLRDPPHKVLLGEANVGYARTCNRAARIAQGRYLALLNSDLVFTHGWLEPMLAAFTRFGDTGIVGNLQYRAATGCLDHAGVQIDTLGRPEHLDTRRGAPLLLAAYRTHAAITGACCVIERALFLHHGGYDEAFINGGEDIDLCLRLRQAGLAVRVAHRSRVLHHVSASPGRKKHDEENCRRLFFKWRAQLIEDGARSWPREFCHDFCLNPHQRYPWPIFMAALLRRYGLCRSTSSYARELLARNLHLREVRWEQMFGRPPPSP